MSYQVWDLRSANRLFTSVSRDAALLWALQLLPSQGVEDISVIGPDDAVLEGDALLTALGEVLWGRVQPIVEPASGGVEVAVQTLQSELVYA